MRFVTAAALAALVFVSAPQSASAGDAERGEALFDLCTQCHGSAGQGNPMALAPSIAGLSEWYVTAQLKNFKKGVRGMHPDDMGGLRMYPMSLSLRSEDDIEAVAAYVASLPLADPAPTVEGGNAAKGAEYWKTCASCHGPDGTGNKELNAPRLVGVSDWYLFEALKKYKAGIRGWNTGNQPAVMMRGMAMSLPDEQAIRDVIAYIHELEN
jgi:cytochrome c oxidase subunit 2